MGSRTSCLSMSSAHPAASRRLSLPISMCRGRNCNERFTRKAQAMLHLSLKEKSTRWNKVCSSVNRPISSLPLLTDLSVINTIQEKGFLPEDFVESETHWVYNELGIDDMYFSTESVDTIASHIHSLYAAKIAAYARDDQKLDIRLDKEAADHAVYIDTSTPGISVVDGPRYEQRIDEKYLDGSTRERAYRVETFRSSSQLPGGQQEKLRCYFVYQCDFVEPKVSPEETRLELIGDKRFLQKATQNTKEIYQEVIDMATVRSGPVIEMFDIEGQKDKRVVIAFKQGSALGFFSALSDLV